MNIDQWLHHEARFAANGYDGTPDRELFIINNPTSRLWLISVHGVNHFRPDQSLKPADLYTGGLTLSLAIQMGCNALVVGCRNPAFDPHHGEMPLDRLLRNHVTSDSRIIDIHGARHRDEFDMAIGLSGLPVSSQQADFCHRIESSLNANGVRTAVNHPAYSAIGTSTMTHRLRANGYNRVAQLEITRGLRDLHANPQRAAGTLRSMQQLVTALGQ